MSNVFKRPMFRRGGGVNMNGIMSGIRDEYEDGGPTARERYEQIIKNYENPAMDPLSKLLIQGGLRGLSETRGGGTLANLAMAFQEPTDQLFSDLQRRKDLQREAELAGLEMDIADERERKARMQKLADVKAQQDFQIMEGEKDRQLKRDLALAEDTENTYVKTAKIILGANASAEEIGSMASKIANEKTFGVSERAKQSSIEKQKESIEEKFGLTAGVLENYYNFTSSGRAAELSEKTNKTFIGPIKKKTDRKGRGKYVTKNKFGLYFDPVNNIAVEVNADGSYVTY